MSNDNALEEINEQLVEINKQLEKARKELEEKRRAQEQWYDIDSRREGGSIRQDLSHENRRDKIEQSINEQERKVTEVEHLKAQLELKKLAAEHKEVLKPEEPEVDDIEKLKESAE
jgi:hypothetical protein